MPGFSLPAFVRVLLVWLLIIAAESAQGALRHLLLGPEVQFLVRQVSVLTGAIIIFALAWACRGWTRIRTASGALATGVLWVVLTVAFEIVLGAKFSSGATRRRSGLMGGIHRNNYPPRRRRFGISDSRNPPDGLGRSGPGRTALQMFQ
jgi:hypothetical protein